MTEGHKDCSEVIHQIFVFIDNELDQASCGEIQQHLDECGPCLAKYNLERTVKALVARSCTEHAPDDLRQKVLMRIREVHVTLTETETTLGPGTIRPLGS
ncbi:mycothiol system anti-sigma-R factor [Nocardioides pocheonensis]|uniref:Mycothiol system anti-sigma-R factor n=1 Tax=Nocardioides pocheonensis TaxID=661485 RepID=A0A3N0GS74_9ACTN|nr:mycothiol system anti-sigma-R factor [Nocardioides pocheonensis]RNM15251.1 mycothiol system anti-sigma-R factor [Nocardioides pocheonensis]